MELTKMKIKVIFWNYPIINREFSKKQIRNSNTFQKLICLFLD